MYNESVEFHVLSIEGSDKNRIRRTNGTPHCVLMSVVRWLYAKRRAYAGSADTQEKSAVRESLIRWKLSDFQLRTA